MNRRRVLVGVGAVAGGILLLVVLTLLFLPSREIVGVVQRTMARQGLTLEMGSVGKVLPLGVTARQVMITSEQGPIFAADRLTCRFHLLPLLLGRMQWSADAAMGTGTLSLDGTLGKRPEVTVTSRDLRLERLPLLKSALGGRVQGAFSINGSFHGVWPAAKGNLTLDSAGVDLSGLSLGGMRLPDAIYRTVRGQFLVDGGTVVLQSFALDGDGIYARLKGSFPVTAPITASPLNLTLDLMPKPEFVDQQKDIFFLLSRFMVSPGNFQIPIKGTIGAPLL